MSGKPNSDRRSLRRDATRAEIVAAAWQLAQQKGLSGIAMRDLGELVNMRAQSIYTYFDSKFEIYDAMFLEGYRDFAHGIDLLLNDVDPHAEPTRLFRLAAHGFFDFCTADAVRFQLLFQRTIPGFEPSPESWKVALDAFEAMAGAFRKAGLESPEALDVWTALVTGLSDQQISNDPGGDRWRRVVDQSVDMYLAYFNIHSPRPVPPSTGSREVSK